MAEAAPEDVVEVKVDPVAIPPAAIDPYQELRQQPFDAQEYSDLCGHFLQPRTTTHSVRESQTRGGTIRSTPRQSANFRLIDNLRNPTLTQRLLELWEAGGEGQEDLLWALRCLRLYCSGVRQPLPPQLQREAGRGRESDDGEVQALIVIDGDDDMDDVIDVGTYLVECLITKVVKPDPAS